MSGYIGGPKNASDDEDLNLVFEFDKFMDDITKREDRVNRTVLEEEMSPQRRYFKLYQDRWQNRTRITRK